MRSPPSSDAASSWDGTGPATELAWHRLTPESLFALLVTTPDGLSAREAARRLSLEGRNELRDTKHARPAQVLFRQFNSRLVWLLLAASVVSGALGEWLDSAAITLILLLNGLVGFYQEWNAEKSIAALKKMTAPGARVRRGGVVTTLPAAEVVRGDILELEAGAVVPADARLIEAVSLQCAEAPLTGESLPVSKHAGVPGDAPLAERVNMVFMGTHVATGWGRAVVVATGMETEIGRIGALIEGEKEEETPLQKKLAGLGRVLTRISLGIVALLFLLGLARGLPWPEMLLTSVSLSVAAVPEGLPVVVTIALALGVTRMARRGVLMRRLPA
ncbi:MAG TPA: HAD-IC family P-type ATPase, partial [Verrucomicrobiae bacterium]|nr:HAD-IC family P-type ATPase [Verrucomicrobiae bacterium]